MMRRRLTLIGASAAALLMLTGAVLAYNLGPKSELLDRFTKASEVLERAANAAGGAAQIRTLKSLAFTVDGSIFNDVQGYTPAKLGAPDRDGRFRATNAFDFANATYYQRTLQELQGGFGLESASLYKDKTLYFIRYTSSDFTATPNAPPPDGAAGFVAAAARFSPIMALQRALRNARSAAWVGETDIEGQKADIVEFSWDETQRLRLVVGRGDNRVRYLEAINPDPVSGDAASIVQYEGDQTIAGLRFPARIKSFRRGARLLELDVKDVKVNEPAPAGTFEIDRTFKELQPEKIETVSLGDGLYEIKGLGNGQYRSQFIVMDDFVVGFEALLGYPVSSQILAEIKKVAPDKPVKYVVLSHFHSDHAGGIGAYGEIGAKVVTAPENRDVLTAYANARSALAGQPRLRSPIILDFAFVEAEGMDITDRAGRTLKIVNFRNTPHVASVLAIYDAKTKTVINGDLYSDIVRYNRTFDVFVDWLKATKLEIDWILGTHHPKIARADLLATAAAERRKRRR